MTNWSALSSHALAQFSLSRACALGFALRVPALSPSPPLALLLVAAVGPHAWASGTAGDGALSFALVVYFYLSLILGSALGTWFVGRPSLVGSYLSSRRLATRSPRSLVSYNSWYFLRLHLFRVATDAPGS